MAADSVAPGVVAVAAPGAAIAGNRHLFLEGILPCYYYDYQIHSQARFGPSRLSPLLFITELPLSSSDQICCSVVRRSEIKIQEC